MQLVKDTVITLIIETLQLIYAQWNVLPVSNGYFRKSLCSIWGGGGGGGVWYWYSLGGGGGWYSLFLSYIFITRHTLEVLYFLIGSLCVHLFVVHMYVHPSALRFRLIS